MKKYLALLMVVLMALGLLLGCAEAQTEEAATTAAEATESPVATEPSATRRNLNRSPSPLPSMWPTLKTRKRIWRKSSMRLKRRTRTSRWKSPAAKYPSITRRWRCLPARTIYPIFSRLEQATAQEFAENGYLYDLTDALDQYGINDSLLPGLVHCCTVDGRDYSMPSEIMMVGFFYNKAIFEENGLTAPTTYEEFMDVVGTLADNGVTPLAIGSKSNFSVWAFETMLARYGFFDKLAGLNSGEISWVNDDFIHYFEKVAEMREAGAFSKDAANMDYFQAKEVFLAGNAAMFNTGAWDIGDFERSDIASQIGFFWDRRSPTAHITRKLRSKRPEVYTVSQKAAEDPAVLDAVLKFWSFYYGTEGTKIIAEETAGLPCSSYSGTIDATQHPVLATMITALNDDWQAVTEPFNSLSTNVAYGFFDATQGVITGVYTPEEAAEYVEGLHALER